MLWVAPEVLGVGDGLNGYSPAVDMCCWCINGVVTNLRASTDLRLVLLILCCCLPAVATTRK
jgi:hypothetical protein